MAAVLLLGTSACDKGTQPAAPKEPTIATEPDKPRLTLIVPESTEWSQEQALQHMADDDARVSAAIQLVRLAKVHPLWLPPQLTDATVSQLRVLQLSEDLWALGFADRRSELVLHAPVLIAADGSVTAIAGGTEEEALLLHASRDADVFPHLLIAPGRVLIAAANPEVALTLDYPMTVGFHRRERDGFPYLALMWRGDADWVEVAQYRWEPFELALAGPASDELPDPPGGAFALDMEASPMLIPVGGEIPEPKPRQQEPPPNAGPNWNEA